MPDCVYCQELETGFLEIGGSNWGNRIVFETDNFVVFPGLGPIVEGYLLIASKDHYMGLGNVPTELYSELESVQTKVRSILTQNYTPPLFFEHGPVSRMNKGGCCIEHAHLHALPVKVDITSELTHSFHHSIITSYDALKTQFQKGVPYFFYETNTGERHLFAVQESVPSQYIRKLIAQKVGKPERADWQSYLELEEVVRTAQTLKAAFANRE